MLRTYSIFAYRTLTILHTYIPILNIEFTTFDKILYYKCKFYVDVWVWGVVLKIP